MTTWQLIRRGLAHHWRIHLAVALGVMAGTAVLTGALLVGDSVRGSLRDLALDRLGSIDVALVAPHFFREELAAEVTSQPSASEHFGEAIPAIILRASLARDGYAAESANDQDGGQGFSGRVMLYAVPPEFWQLGTGGPQQPPRPANETSLADAEVVLNEPLAAELGAAVGDTVLLHLPEASLVPRETTLGRKSGFTALARLKVAEVVPARGLGRFGLEPNQQLPLVAFAPLPTVQDVVKQLGKVNALLVPSRGAAGEQPPAGAETALQEHLHPQVGDYGVKVEPVSPAQKNRGQRQHGDISYLNVTTDRMLFESPVEQATLEAFAAQGAQPTLTYLANAIAAGPPLSAEAAAKLGDDAPRPNSIPYSTVTALNFPAANDDRGLGRWISTLGARDELIERLADDEIALNSWALDDLNQQLQASGHPPLKQGDTIRLTFFEPEHPDGKSVESTVAFKLRAVFPLVEGHPANDRNFTPTVKGVTDRRSIANWDAPFDYYQGRVRPEDDDYWEDYRATPKAFVSLATAQRLWGTRRFGRVTSIRIPAGDGLTAESVATKLAAQIEPQDLGFVFRPVKRQALAAATGTTPFGVLFISFSFFIIAAAAMLVAILFRLGVERRAAEVGTLLAEGFAPRRVRRLLAAEGLIVAAAGGLLGMLAGTAYAAVMLHGLRTWWSQAVSAPFLELHVSWVSFVVGYLSGVVICFAAVAWTLWRMRRLAVRRLLAGQATEETELTTSRPTISRWVAVGALALGAILVIVASTMGGMAQAGAFFGSGFAVLVGLLAATWGLLRAGSTGSLDSSAPLPLVRMAARNGARHPGRSTLTIGLVASATFLVVALSVFQIDPSQQRPDLASGNGGFLLVAESSSPIVVDINEELAADSTKRSAPVLNLQDDERPRLAGATVFSLRVQPGEDASCRNLYQATRPRVLGVPRDFIDRGGFAWAGSLATTAEEKQNPWRLLRVGRMDNPSYEALPIPVVLDANTAQWSLHLRGDFGSPLGAIFTITDDWGREIPLKAVGLLSNSIFQGDVLMGEADFLRQFPAATGKGFFLVELPPAQATPERVTEVRGLLEKGLADSGFDAESTGQRLAGFLAIQNTYLSTFQSLGALGLLLGTFGLATVQLRSVLERRGELALLRATGFRLARLAELVMAENSLLLLAGLGAGTLAALAAVLPHLLIGGARVPIAWLALSLSGILLVGLAAGLVAVRATLRAPLIQALRGE
jgi:ABC-type lipoprotein release transport system permease subunit